MNTEQKKDSMKELEQDVLLLKESMNIIHELVSEQQVELNTIEQCIEESKHEVKEAAIELKETETNHSYWNYIYASSMSGAILFIYLLL